MYTIRFGQFMFGPYDMTQTIQEQHQLLQKTDLIDSIISDDIKCST